MRPDGHESWCAEHGYEDCTCDLEVRQRRWDAENRQATAKPLPVARLVNSNAGQSALEAATAKLVEQMEEK